MLAPEAHGVSAPRACARMAKAWSIDFWKPTLALFDPLPSLVLAKPWLFPIQKIQYSQRSRIRSPRAFVSLCAHYLAFDVGHTDNRRTLLESVLAEKRQRERQKARGDAATNHLSSLNATVASGGRWIRIECWRPIHSRSSLCTPP